MSVRVADEVLTILAEAALENEQIDRATVATDIAQNLKKEENVVVVEDWRKHCGRGFWRANRRQK